MHTYSFFCNFLNMKKLIILLLFVPVISFSQSVNGVPFAEIDSPFIEIVGTQKLLSSKVTIFIDFGQRTKLFGNNKKQFSILDKEGKKVEFNSMIDALNFMTTNGYVFEQAYTVTIGQSNVYHFLMSKK